MSTICGRNAPAVKKAAIQLGWEKSATDWRTVVDDPAIDIIGIASLTSLTARLRSRRRRRARPSSVKNRSRLMRMKRSAWLSRCARRRWSIWSTTITGACPRLPSRGRWLRGRVGRTVVRLSRPLCAGLDRRSRLPARLALAAGGSRFRLVRRHRLARAKKCLTIRNQRRRRLAALRSRQMNRLQFYSARDPEGERAFREIIVTEAPHPYIEAWWPPGGICSATNTASCIRSRTSLGQ
jgi:hypothetical protein